jgi:predicted nuclease with TOPRIM domain
MLSLLKNERFLAEYNEWKNKIDDLDNPNLKTELQELLNKLVFEIKKLDNQHQELFSSHHLPIGVAETKSNIVDIRKKILKKLRDYSS